jgi:hypothetical protein
MQKTKWTTLVGSTVAVTTSTLLYINIMCMIAAGASASENPSIWWTSPWLNAFTFGINMDSVANDVGLALASGILSRMPLSGRMSKRSDRDRNIMVVPEPSFAPNSQASSTYIDAEITDVGVVANLKVTVAKVRPSKL